MFNDKHFSYSMEDGLWMWNRAKELDIPLFAGSSLVVCYRRPFLEHPKVRRPKPRTGFAAPATCCSCHCSSSSSCCCCCCCCTVWLHPVWAADLSAALGQGAPIEDALIISGGGPDGYHTLEALQCMVERRAGGEAGVAAVTVLKGEEMWAACDATTGALAQPMALPAARNWR